VSKPETPQRPDPIPVKALRFRQAVDLPGKTGASSVTATADDTKARHTIEFLPWLRAFRVTWHTLEVVDGVRRSPQQIMIHETWATWEPG
jgi:hypothetical protein